MPTTPNPNEVIQAAQAAHAELIQAKLLEVQDILNSENEGLYKHGHVPVLIQVKNSTNHLMKELSKTFGIAGPTDPQPNPTPID